MIMSIERPDVGLTFDFDGMSLWIGSFRSKNVSLISRGEFGVIGLKRLLALLAKKDIKASFMIPGHTAYCYPDLIKRIHDEGHEIGAHGWVHENPVLAGGPEEERANVERGLEAIDRVLGIRPLGYRTPAWDFSAATLDILIDLGFVWESSIMSVDFHPFYPRSGDVVSQTEPYVFGKLRNIVEFPASWWEDDFPTSEFVWPTKDYGLIPGYVAPSAIWEMWMGDFDYMADNEPAGIFGMTMHPQVIGRANRIAMLERMIDHMLARGAKFWRVLDYIQPWMEAHPLEQWAKENPELSGEAAYKFEAV